MGEPELIVGISSVARPWRVPRLGRHAITYACCRSRESVCCLAQLMFVQAGKTQTCSRRGSPVHHEGSAGIECHASVLRRVCTASDLCDRQISIAPAAGIAIGRSLCAIESSASGRSTPKRLAAASEMHGCVAIVPSSEYWRRTGWVGPDNRARGARIRSEPTDGDER
jgi:hypothetical protein